MISWSRLIAYNPICCYHVLYLLYQITHFHKSFQSSS